MSRSVAVYEPGVKNTVEVFATSGTARSAENEQMSWDRYGPLKAECDRIVQKGLGRVRHDRAPDLHRRSE